MGNLLSGFIALFPTKEETKILMVGLYAAGKTTILYKFKIGEIVTTIPIMGFIVETLQYKTVSIITWDIGADKIKALWRRYYQNATHIIFVVDSNDRDRIQEAKNELFIMLQEEELRDIPILVFANKQDLPNVMSVEEITDKLELNSIPDTRSWFVTPSCAITGDGLYEGLDWISNGAPFNPQRFKKAKNARSIA